ncbi:hypothetical protein ISTM_349 [Insectomime virus]|uniref:Uncharacterized protein n=1 Tax=Tunisvirus fontaine2 TaxID=1421067 RepID=V9SE33_9VIRU|nr:hypothetical protein D1R32_gp451 [Tunisvirus fontaine2]AHA46247.1 hypothetical protein ISTM_349 [Insectomime virus]AHC55168.1 hypothetical protein TNS_ORF450 [Tunisvirus fontaine2]
MADYYRYSQKIPKVDNLRERVEKLTPFWFDKESKMCFELKKNDGFNTSFVWGREEILCLGEYDDSYGVFIKEGEEEKFVKAFESREYITYHMYGYHGCFKPSLSEVAAFLPQELFDDHEKLWVTSQAIYLSPEHCYPIGTDQGVHVAKTIVLFKNI